MNDILTEKQYQHEIMDYLQDHDGYRIRKATDYDRAFAMDRGMLFEFLNQSQPDVMNELRKIFKEDTEETIASLPAETARAARAKTPALYATAARLEVNRRPGIRRTSPTSST